MKTNLYNYILELADNCLIAGQRLGELCGHGPSLETDIACTNISLDLFGQTRSYFQYADATVAAPPVLPECPVRLSATCACAAHIGK